MTTSLSPELLVQMRLAHLETIQGVIARLSGFSANAKNFCITILAALVAVAFQKPVPTLVWAGCAVPLLFGLLDAYYLAQEKRFRGFYQTVSSAPLDHAQDLALTPAALKPCHVLRAARSGSVGAVYLAMLVGIALLLCIAGNQPANARTASAECAGAAQVAAQRQTDHLPLGRTRQARPGASVAG